MKWVGLTGGLASGKSAAHQELEMKGYSVVDADLLARLVVRPGSVGWQRVVETFGQKIVKSSQEIDRQRLAEIVFNDSQKLSHLESLLHPLIAQESERQRRELEEKGVAIAFYVVPLLFEKKMQDSFDHTVLISCRPEIQLTRLMKRDCLSELQARQRLSCQLELLEKEKLADVVIQNNGSIEELSLAIGKYLASIPSP